MQPKFADYGRYIGFRQISRNRPLSAALPILLPGENLSRRTSSAAKATGTIAHRVFQTALRQTLAACPRVSGNYLRETLSLAPQGPSKIAQGNALGTV